MLFAWMLSALGLAFGAALGFRGLIDPHWAARLVRLREDEQGGGFAEFRATYGGVFFGLHAAALFFALKWMFGGEPVVGAVAAGAAAAVAAGWMGAAFGRAMSMWRDGARTRFNMMSVGLEAFVAIVIGGPWVLWSFGVAA